MFESKIVLIFFKEIHCILDLARKNKGKAIDKETFLQLFNLPGIVGERLFHVFD
jgi:hypothetical protein